MVLRHRRSLHPGGCDDWNESGCSSLPSPSPSPPPSFPSLPPSWISCPPTPVLAPSPSPAHGARRYQGGGHDYSPPVGRGGGSGSADHHRRIVTIALVATAALVFISLILLGVSVAVRRRQVRRRRQALLAAGAAGAGANAVGGGNDDPEGGGGGVVHHVWYIRTVGLDEAAIDSIAATRYRAGVGLLGAADCSVCLGELQDGELVRLLPKCGHAFHVLCIDTWLRAHVNCPLCRSDVVDSAATGAAGGEPSSNPPADPDADAAEQTPAASAAAIPDHEEESNDQEAPHVGEDHNEQLRSPEPWPSRLPCPLPRSGRRAASMDSALVSAAEDTAALERLPEEAAPEEEQGGRRKHRADAKVSGSGHQSGLAAPMSFFSRHCRARSSALPL